MELKCKINGKEHKITQGVSFSEEYNETLDSGSVIITSNEQLDIKPYDDVFFYDNEFNGYNFDSSPKTAYSYSEKKQIGEYSQKVYLNKKLLNLNVDMKCKTNIEYHPKNKDPYSIKYTSSNRRYTVIKKTTYFNFEKFYYVVNPFNKKEVYFFGGIEILEDGTQTGNFKLRKTNSKFSDFTEGVNIFSEYEPDKIIEYRILNSGIKDINPVLLENNGIIEIYYVVQTSINSSPRIAKISFDPSTSKATFGFAGKTGIGDTNPWSLCADYKSRRLYLSYTSESPIIIPGGPGYDSGIYCYNLASGSTEPELIDFGMQSTSDMISFPQHFFNSFFTSNENYTEFYLFTGGYKLKLSDYKTLESKNTFELEGEFSPIIKKDGNNIINFGFAGFKRSGSYNFYNFYDYLGTSKKYLVEPAPVEIRGAIASILNYANTSSFDFAIDFNFKLQEIDYFNTIKTEIVTNVIKTNDKITLNFTAPTNALIPNEFVFTQDTEKENKLSTLIDYSQRKILVNIDFVLEFTISYPILNPKNDNKFYKHLLVDSVVEEILNLKEKIYRYKVSLFSETKGLEIVQLPNKSITQPLIKSKKKNVNEYAKEILELYSPKIKMRDSQYGDTWSLVPKYKLSDDIEVIFKDAIAPDFSENNPNLRDMLSKLFVVKDRIPVVEDDIIYARDITERKGPFDLTKGQINYINSTLSSANYCNNLKKNYNEALSQVGSGRYVEHLGFRNSDEALMTLENMRIETKFPIYKINKIYMCYYKKMAFKKSEDTTVSVKAFLCKQDITPLVKLNSERNLLSQDWDTFTDTRPSSIEEMAKYKLCTVGYDIGSKYITGWGTKYKYPKGWWQGDGTATYIQNIASILDVIRPYGIYDYGYLTKCLQTEWGNDVYISNYDVDFFNNLIAPTASITNDEDNKFNKSVKLKCFTFIIDYEPFYSGTIIHSKSFGDKDITINDNPSASLTLLEADGLFTQEKLNRYGNKNITIPARYTNFEDLQGLGTVYNNEKDNDVIIYHKEYSIFNNVINCTYFGSKDYVLKNYFTTVWAKHRTYNLMNYGESITRAENKKIYLLMSKKSAYYEKQNDKNLLVLDNFENGSFLKQMFSFFNENEKAITIDYFIDKNKINFAYFVKKDKEGDKIFVTDVNSFVSGNSLCLNICMFDNVMAGTYIENFSPFDGRSWFDMLLPTKDDIANDYTGSVQGWYNLVDDDKTGRIEKISFYFSHFDLTKKIMDSVFEFDNNNEQRIKNVYYDYLFQLPNVKGSILEDQKNIIGCKDYPVYKDNKEKLDFTLQFETITDDENVMFSSWLMKLGNLITPYKKTYSNYKVTDVGTNKNILFFDLVATTKLDDSYGEVLPNLFLKFKQEDFSKFKPGDNLLGEAVWGEDISIWTDKVLNVIIAFFLKIKKIKSISENGNSITLVCDYRVRVNWAWGWGNINDGFASNVELTFNKVTDEDIDINSKFYKGYNFFKYEWKKITFLDTNGKEHTFGTTGSIIFGEDGIIKCSNGKRYANFAPLNNDTSIITKCNVFSLDTDIKTKEYKKNLYLAYTSENLKKETVYDEFEQWKYKKNDNELDYKNNISFGVVEEENEVPYLQILIDKNIIQKNNEDGTYGSIRLYFLDTTGDEWYHFVFGVNITKEEYNNPIMNGELEVCKIKIYLSSLYTKDNHIYDENHNLIGENQNYVKSGNKTYGQNQYFYDIINQKEE